MDFSIIQGHPIAGAVMPFRSIATVTPNALAHDCILLVSDKTYERLVFTYRLLSQGAMQRVYDGTVKALTKSIQKKEMYHWNSVSSKYNLVTALTSFDTNNLLIGITSSDNNSHKLGLDAICPYSAFTNPNIPYKLISFDQMVNLLQQGLIVRFEVNPNYQKYFGLTNEPNKIVTIFDRNGNGYLVKGKLKSDGMIHRPV